MQKAFAGFGYATGPTYESTIAYNYDAGNRIASVVDSVTGTITPTFDNLNRLTEELTPQGTVDYTYDGANRRTSTTVAGQTAIDYSYDNANRLTQISQGIPTVSFAYDSAYRRTSLTLPNGVEISYGYNNGSQLTGLTYTRSAITLGSLTYSYDGAGRRITQGGSYAQTELPSAISTTTYNAANQLTQWGSASPSYDANGNMTSDGTNSFTWSARNKLASMNSSAISFQYDPYGRRVAKTVAGITTNYLYDRANIVQELSGGSPIANLLSGGIDEVFTRTDSSGTVNFLTDALKSTINLTNASGSSLAQYAYEPFGNATVIAGGSANEFQYTGRDNDGTNLYFYRARYYNPLLQRFISQDPLGFRGGINLYSYAKDDPLNQTDPLGLDTVFIGLGGSGSLSGWGGTGSIGFVFDGSGGVGIAITGGFSAGSGIGAGFSGGITGAFSNAQSIGDTAGPFFGASVSAGDGVGASVDGFAGPSADGEVTGIGVTGGVGVGASISVGVTRTCVISLTGRSSYGCP